MKTVYLGLGSNLGNREENLQAARERLESPELHVLRVSALYETEPRDVPDQPWFLNQVVEADTSLFPRQLLARLKKIERALGRRPTRPKGPRVVDLDILLFANAVVQAEDLEIPHPRLGERRFVLEPLNELAPELRHPVTRSTVREMLMLVANQTVRRVEA